MHFDPFHLQGGRTGEGRSRSLLIIDLREFPQERLREEHGSAFGHNPVDSQTPFGFPPHKEAQSLDFEAPGLAFEGDPLQD